MKAQAHFWAAVAILGAPVSDRSSDVVWRRFVRAARERRLRHALRTRLEPPLRGALARAPHDVEITVAMPSPRTPDPRDRPVVERVVRAFRAMKARQAGVDRRYLPAALWQRLLDAGYTPLARALDADDLTEAHEFLANFGVAPRYLGIDSTLVHRWARSRAGRRYLARVVFPRQLARWRRYWGGTRPVSALRHPRHGNPIGATIDGVFVGQEHVFFDDAYVALLRGLLADRERPRIAELGGGYGEFAEMLLRMLPRFAYVEFDLPETLSLAAYYMLQSFPERSVLLYGERPYEPRVHEAYDIVLMPCWEIEALADRGVDLFVNRNSLGEMTAPAVANYVHHITRATEFFFHMNHDVTPEDCGDGERGVLARDYPVPVDQFTLLFRYPELDHLLRSGWEDVTSDIVVHLYQRRGSG